MKWSFKVARVAGIDVKIHATFLMLLLWLGWANYRATQSTAAAIAALVAILLLFVSVLLHEFGHALVARRYGISTKDITLLPIGGVAQLERMPKNPRHELAVALAGPAVNVVIAVGLFFMLGTLGRLDLPHAPDLPGTGILSQVMFANVALAVFNLLPAFPMDGGRVLRALLALRMGYGRATQVAASIGQGMALLFGLIGLVWNPILVFVALFVWLGASEEGKHSMLQSAMEGIEVGAAMARDVRALKPDDRLESAIAHILEGHQQDLPVLEGARVVGVLTRSKLLHALASDGPQARVGDVMATDIAMAHPDEMLANAHARLQEGECQSMPVVDDADRLVGILTTENIGELLLIQAALRDRNLAAATRAQR
jgi:Zn-dependent protease/CBS domain-containing protein